MAVTILSVIAMTPEWVPDDSTEEALRSLAVRLFSGKSEGVSVVDLGRVEFIDQGEFFDYVKCPNCGSDIDGDWWGDRMDDASNQDFINLAICVPCCGFSTSLNDLKYHLPAGFARFLIKVIDPDGGFAEEGELDLLSKAAGRPMRQILARY